MGSPEFEFSIVFYTYWGNVRLANCFLGSSYCVLHALGQYHANELLLQGIARVHVLYYVLHALGQYQTSELLLWERLNSRFLLCFTRIGAISELPSQTNTDYNWEIVVIASLSPQGIWSTFRAHPDHKQCPTRSQTRWLESHTFFCVLHAFRQYQTSELLLRDRRESCFLLRFTRIVAVSGERAASAGSSEFIFYYILHTLVQYQTSEVLLRDRPTTFYKFTRIETVSF